MFLLSLRNGFGGLLRFSGRDRPGLFWPYAGVVLGVTMLAWMTAFLTQLARLGQRIDRIARDHPEDVVITRGPGHYSVEVHGNHPELMPDFLFLLQAMTVIVFVAALLLAAAVVRRLHDSDLRGWWALVPLTLLFFGLHLMGVYFHDLAGAGGAEFDMAPFLRIFAVNLAYLASLGGLLYALVRKGTVGPNRFGPHSG